MIQPEPMTFQHFACPLCRKRMLSLETPIAPERREAFMFTMKHAGGTERVTLEVWTVDTGSKPVRHVSAVHTCPATYDRRNQP